MEAAARPAAEATEQTAAEATAQSCALVGGTPSAAVPVARLPLSTAAAALALARHGRRRRVTDAVRMLAGRRMSAAVDIPAVKHARGRGLRTPCRVCAVCRPVCCAASDIVKRKCVCFAIPR